MIVVVMIVFVFLAAASPAVAAQQGSDDPGQPRVFQMLWTWFLDLVGSPRTHPTNQVPPLKSEDDPGSFIDPNGLTVPTQPTGSLLDPNASEPGEDGGSVMDPDG